MQTLAQLLQECLNHGIVDVYEDFPYIDQMTGDITLQAALRKWCLDALANHGNT